MAVLQASEAVTGLAAIINCMSWGDLCCDEFDVDDDDDAFAGRKYDIWN